MFIKKTSIFIFINYIILQTFSLKSIESFNCLLTCFILIFVFNLLFNFILSKFLLGNDREQAIPAEIGTTTKTIPVIDNVTDFEFAAIITTVSSDFYNVFKFL